MAASDVHFRTCSLCESMCGIEVHVARPPGQRDQIVSIRGDAADPFSRGHVCPKAPALAELYDDPDRLRQPLRRIGSDWTPVSWDEALGEAADRLHAIGRAHGRNAVALYAGNPTVHHHGALLYGALLTRALRTRNRYSATSVDQLPHQLVAYLAFGHQLLLPVPDVDRTDMVLMLGANPLVSNGSLMSLGDAKGRLRAIQARGGKLVVIDPRRTPTAELADLHHFIRPGTDALLLLAMIETIVREGLERTSHLHPRTRGLAEVRAAAMAYPAERVATATGIDAAAIRRLARSFAAAPRAVAYARMGGSTQQFGTLTQWATLALNLITGNLDREGGAMFTHPAFDVVHPPLGVQIGRGSFGRFRSRVRGLRESGGELPVATLADEILTPGRGQVRALLTIAGNPVLSTPGGARLEQALRGLDFMVSVDPYLNETTRHAHLILPPPSPLETSHFDVAFNALAVRNVAKWSPAAVATDGDTRPDWWILNELRERLETAQRGSGGIMGAWTRAALRRLGPDGIVDLGLRLGPYGALRRPGISGGLSLAALRRAPHGIDLGPLRPGLLERLPRGRTAIDAAPSPILADLRRLERELLSPAGPPQGPRELRLIGRRLLRSNNSWMHNAPKLATSRDAPCTLLMHPDDARARGLTHGGRARLTSRVGQLDVEVRASDELMPGVVSLPHGYGHDRDGVRLATAARRPGVSLNDITDPELLDELSGNAALNGVPVHVAALAR